MVKAAAALLASFSFLPFLGGHRHPLDRARLEHAILAQMNGSAVGDVTRSVSCRHAGAALTSYVCRVEGSRATTTALVTVHGGSWQARWAPLNG